MINLTLMFFSHSLTVRVYRLSCDTVTGTGWSFKSSLRHKISSETWEERRVCLYNIEQIQPVWYMYSNNQENLEEIFSSPEGTFNPKFNFLVEKSCQFKVKKWGKRFSLASSVTYEEIFPYILYQCSALSAGY